MNFAFRVVSTAVILLSFFSVAPMAAQDGVVRGQYLSLSAGLGLEDEGFPENRPSALAAGVEGGYAFDGPFRISIAGTVGRRSFDLGTDKYHRNLVFLDIGPEFAVVRTAKVELGVRLGIGARMDDDVNETDPEFRSSANWDGALVPGIVLRHRLSNSLAVMARLKDFVIDIPNRLFDPSEADVRHDVLLELGLIFR